ncbi:MAG: trypsin-like peptidase domain-containing protein [Lachnospiraceae bacterium]|nr:trypsin-like peptidase domain-containing protein [Lachnospiraceae bacterium]
MYGENGNNEYGSNNGMYGDRTGGNGYGQYTAVNPAQAPVQAAPKKKKSGVFSKICLAAAVGLFFGLFAGAGLYLVQQAGSLLGLDMGIGNGGERGAYTEYTDKEKAERAEVISEAVAMPAASTSATTVVTDVTNVVEQVMPAIVSITNESTVNYFYYTMPSESSGSGIIIGSNSEELLLVTNYHVVADNESLKVCFTDGSEATALVKGTDSQRDLAVIAVAMDDISDSTLNSIKVARMGDSDALKVGEPAIAIGNALGYGQSVTTGVISALNREMTVENITGTFIQTDAAINPGNSGGALLNINGEVIGINSSKIGGSTVEGMGYAIPISAAKPIIEELMQKTTRTLVSEDERGYLGITGATVTQQEIMLYGYPEGVYVANVNDGSPADLAGMQRGDYITALDGETVTSMEGLQRLLMYYRVGDTVEVEIKRPDGNRYKDMTLELTLGDRSSLGRTN